MLNRRRGQSILEYAMIVAVVVAAFLAIQIYMKRGVQGKLRSSVDDIGGQFEAAKTKVVSETNRAGITVEETSLGVTTVSTGTGSSAKAEVSTSKGSESVDAFK